MEVNANDIFNKQKIYNEMVSSNQSLFFHGIVDKLRYTECVIT